MHRAQRCRRIKKRGINSRSPIRSRTCFVGMTERSVGMTDRDMGMTEKIAE